MTEVKIRKVTTQIPMKGPMGIGLTQSHTYLALYSAGTGDMVPDEFYTLSQEGEMRPCRIIKGRVRGIEWLDESKPIFIV